MHYLSTRFLTVGLVAGLLFLAGCDSGGANEEPSDPDDPTENADPTASVSVDETTVTVGTQVTLDASGSSDPDNDDLSFSWTLDTPSGSSAQLSDDTAEQPTFTPDVVGDYTATVTVDDGNDGTDDASVTVTAETANVITVDADITANTTWTSDATYRVTRLINISGAELTIEAGTRIEFEEAAGLFVLGGSSKLTANGTASNRILMTGTTETPGHWLGVGFDSNDNVQVLNGVEIAYAGRTGTTFSGISEPAAVAMDGGASVQIQNAVIRDSETYGLYSDAGSQLSNFSTNTFAANGSASALLPGPMMADLDAASTFDDGDDTTPSEVQVYAASFGDNAVIPALDVPYRVIDGNVLSMGIDFTISEGTQMEFGEASGLFFNGNAKLTINGTSSNPVLLTGVQKTAGYWKGIGFDSGSNQHVIAHTTIEYGGNASTHSGLNEPANIALEDNVLELKNSTLRNSGKWGLYVESGGSSLPNFSTNTFAANADGSALLPSLVTPDLDAASTFDDGDDATPSEVFVYDGGTFGDEVTVSALDVAYRVVDNNIFRIGSNVTIGPGTVMEFGEASGLYVTGSGKLTINGQSGSTVLLTGVQKTAGYWKGIGFDSGSVRHVITYTTVEYGGNASTHSGLNEPANIALEDNVLELRNSTVRNSGKWGLYVEAEGSSLPDFTANLFASNTAAPMYIPPSLIFALDSASDFTNNTERYVLVWNTSTSRGGTVSPLAGDVPYRAQQSALLRFNSEVTIADGVEMEFEEASGIFMGSSSKLVANGTSGDGILMTSAEDSSPTKGFWKGVGFDSNPLTHELAHLTIEFAGGGDMTNVSGRGNLRMDASSNLSLTNCTITNSAGYGIWRDADNSVINETGTTYADNTDGPQNTP